MRDAWGLQPEDATVIPVGWDGPCLQACLHQLGLARRNAYLYVCRWQVGKVAHTMVSNSWKARKKDSMRL